MNNVIEPDINFDFSKLFLGPPTSVGGACFTKLLMDNRSLFIQTPRCISKNGFVKSGKRVYIDLLFDSSDTVFINWIENLESTFVQLLFDNRANLFQNDIDKDDIEGVLSPMMKIYKSGKFYVMRVFAKSSVKIYESENTNDTHSLESIDSTTNIVSIIEVQGVKYTSRSFQIEVDLKQSMIVSADPFSDSCFISFNSRNQKKHENIKEKIEKDKFETVQDFSKIYDDQVKINEDDEHNDTQEIEERDDGDHKTVSILEHTNEDSIEEVDIGFNDQNADTDTISLKTADDIHMDIYFEAKEFAQKMQDEAIKANEKLDNIRKLYGITENY